MKYFLDLRLHGEHRIVFVSGVKLNRSIEEILHTFGLPPNRKISQVLGPTNSGPKKWPSWAQLKFDELFEADEGECRDLFIRACAESDGDFGERIDKRVDTREISDNRLISRD